MKHLRNIPFKKIAAFLFKQAFINSFKFIKSSIIYLIQNPIWILQAIHMYVFRRMTLRVFRYIVYSFSSVIAFISFSISYIYNLSIFEIFQIFTGNFQGLIVSLLFSIGEKLSRWIAHWLMPREDSESVKGPTTASEMISKAKEKLDHTIESYKEESLRKTYKDSKSIFTEENFNYILGIIFIGVILYFFGSDILSLFGFNKGPDPDNQPQQDITLNDERTSRMMSPARSSEEQAKLFDKNKGTLKDLLDRFPAHKDKEMGHSPTDNSLNTYFPEPYDPKLDPLVKGSPNATPKASTSNLPDTTPKASTSKLPEVKDNPWDNVDVD